MKKIIALLLLLFTLTASLFACGKPDTTVAKIGVMSGPTGMGMAKLMNDNDADNPKYDFTVYSNPTTATTDIMAGNLDMLCLPTNTAAMLANKNPEKITVLAINTLGSLYLVTDGNTEIKSISELDGKTIYASVPNSTTGPIIKYLLEKNNVDAEIVFEADHDALVAKVVKNEVSIAVLPEPKVSAALFKNSAYSVDLNLSSEWDKVSDTPLTMGCIVVRNEFLSEHSSLIKDFLKNYKASIEYIVDEKSTDAVDMIINEEIIPAGAPVVKSALNNLRKSIVYIDGEDMKAALLDFYKAINITAPKDEFFYD